MEFGSVRSAYGTRAAEYIEAVGSIEHAREADRNRILQWANSIEGHILDVGSGPGQWTDYLRRNGADIEGIEPVPQFLAAARQHYPESTYRQGRAESLEVSDHSQRGVLAWFSLIHTDPEMIGIPLKEFNRVLAPGGSLLVGFFCGERLETFDHAVATAYYWPIELLAQRIEASGFAVREALLSSDPGQEPAPGNRPQAIIEAIRIEQ